MTFDELYDSLPNGLHDAELRAFRMDYLQRRLTFDLEIWIGELDDDSRREVYRPAIITVEDVDFVYVEPPRDTKDLHIGTTIRVDTGTDIARAVDDPLAHLRGDRPITCMFLSELNSSIFFTTGDTSIEWTGPEDDRTELMWGPGGSKAR